MKKQVVTIVGGGSTYTPGIVQALISEGEKFPIGEIRLYDNNEIRNDDTRAIISYMLKLDNRKDINIIATGNPRKAFEDSDFIFSQIRAGGLEMREKDEKIPLSHGLVGQETCGLGGFAYGLRSLNALLKIVEDIQKYAPEAWILNYTNPESIVAEGIRRRFPDIKMINACDMTISLEQTIAENFGYDHSKWITTYYGLNHFGWYSEIYDITKKRDIMPELIEKLNTNKLKVTSENEGDTTWQDTFHMLSYLTQNFPSHIPNNYLEYYLYPDLIVKKADKEKTRANLVMENREKNNKDMANAIKRNDARDLSFDFGVHGKYIVDIAISILHNENKRFLLLVPNHGAIKNLRDDAVVEIPTYVNEKGVEPISLRNPINDFHKGLMEAQVAAEKLLVDAFFENSYMKALQAFTLNQTVPSAYIAKIVLDEMIEANKDYWPQLN